MSFRGNGLIGFGAVLGSIDATTAGLIGQALVFAGVLLGLVVNYVLAGKSAERADALESKKEAGQRALLDKQADLIVQRIAMLQLEAAQQVRHELHNTAQRLADKTDIQSVELATQMRQTAHAAAVTFAKVTGAPEDSDDENEAALRAALAAASPKRRFRRRRTDA